MKTLNKTALLFIFLFLASNIAWWLIYSSQKSELAKVQAELSQVVQNKKILAFQKLFVEKVLMAAGDVDFATRVDLQNAVTNTGDEVIAKAWQAFLDAKTEAEGQTKVRELLLLISTRAYPETI